ncbi:MAG: D-glycero-beta-D-manno-heptose 1,7-bisphosphate 7-phosphatase [Deltaproteobacteria bacterium]|nr:D-glycero-beta-D-manno-heptose 1,7-bisphosphate 7-phosphatase [Deltaproteobacteria bacterium]
MDATKKQDLTRAVFLDRDGTINEEAGYIRTLQDLKIYPWTIEAISHINAMGMLAVVVSNQSGVARAFFDEAFVGAVHDRIREELALQGARIDRFYYCPHHPTEGRAPYRSDCDCRKPKPGLLLRAARELSIELSGSYMIGDSLRDILAAKACGVKALLVRTGYGKNVSDTTAAIHVADDLLEAVKWIARTKKR